MKDNIVKHRWILLCADSSYFMGNDSDSEKEADGEDTDRLSAVSLACGRDLCSCRRIREWIVGSG